MNPHRDLVAELTDLTGSFFELALRASTASHATTSAAPTPVARPFAPAVPTAVPVAAPAAARPGLPVPIPVPGLSPPGAIPLPDSIPEPPPARTSRTHALLDEIAFLDE